MKRYSTASIDGVEVHYELSGTGEPLVLIHAGIADLSMWDDQMEDCAAHFQVLRYDVRGWGRTPCPPGSYSDHEDLWQLMEHLEIGQAHLLGCSNGGRIAIDFALAYPERVRSLALSGPALGGFEWKNASAEDLAVIEACEVGIRDAYEAEDLDLAAELECKLWVDGLKHTPDAVDPSFRARALALIRAQFDLPEDKGKRVPLEPPAAQRLADLEIPVLLVTGALDTPDILAIAAQIEQEAPDVRRENIPGSAHLPNMEKPADFNRLVLDFLMGK